MAVLLNYHTLRTDLAILKSTLLLPISPQLTLIRRQKQQAIQEIRERMIEVSSQLQEVKSDLERVMMKCEGQLGIEDQQQRLLSELQGVRGQVQQLNVRIRGQQGEVSRLKGELLSAKQERKSIEGEFNLLKQTILTYSKRSQKK